MRAHFKTPILSRSDIVVRLAANKDEVQKANKLVFQNYVEDGFWEDDETRLRTNKFLHSPFRTIFVLLEGGRLIGTMSIIEDSDDGLPSDGTQTPLLNSLRNKGGLIAEVSAFAMDRSQSSRRRLFLMLVSYMMQYSFYHVGVDRLVASCKPDHAAFYETVLCFSKESDLTYYEYSHASGYLISLNLVEAHQILARKYPQDPADKQSFYRFLLCDPQPCQEYPAVPLKRSRGENWAEMGANQMKVA